MALKWHPDKIRNSATILNELLKELAKHTKFSPMQKRGHMICTEHVRERLGLAGRLDMIIEFLFIHYSPRELILHFSIIQNKAISRLAVVQQMESEVQASKSPRSIMSKISAADESRETPRTS